MIKSIQYKMPRLYCVSTFRRPYLLKKRKLQKYFYLKISHKYETRSREEKKNCIHFTHLN